MTPGTLFTYGHLLIRFKTDTKLGTVLTYEAANQTKEAITRTVQKFRAEMAEVGLYLEVVDIDDYGLSHKTMEELEQMRPISE